MDRLELTITLEGDDAATLAEMARVVDQSPQDYAAMVVANDIKAHRINRQVWAEYMTRRHGPGEWVPE